jgi:predicted acetyltransferase
MDVELRPVTDDEFPAYVRQVAAQFGSFVPDREIASARRQMDLGRTIAGFDGDDIVATASAWTFAMTVPGGAAVPTAGVTFVGVQPTHRRRGLLRRMMAMQLDDVARREEPVAALTASESVIYGRFGYGVASVKREWSLRTDGTELLRPPAAAGGIRMLTADDAPKVLPGAYAEAIRRIPGAMSRSEAAWDQWFADPEDERRGASALFFAVHDAGGYVAWRRHGEPVLVVHELHAVDDEVEAALFRFVLDIDLVREVRARRRPVDERLPWRLADPRRLVVEQEVDDLYVRLVDPAAALSARTYGTDDEVVLELHDPFRPANDGRWRVGGAGCQRTSLEPDLALGAPELGSIYLGGVKPSVLARAGRVEERRPGALRRADALFASPVAPWLTMGF